MAVFRVVIPGGAGCGATGFLLIADITGYTMFLTRSELEHAQGILDALFKSIFAEIKAPIILSNLQGDAALTHLPDVNLPQRQFPLDAIERIYCSFSHALGAMRVNTTCTCNACRNMNQLDLKFFLHHGPYATQQMAGRTELQGAEVIRLHRLMKNSVTAETGIKAYALVTEQAADAIGLPDFFATHHPSCREATGDFGDTVCYVYDLAPIYARWRASRRIVVQKDEPLAFESMECDLPVPPAIAWAYVTDVEKKIRWQHGIDGMTMSGLARGRIGQGSTQHCAHGKDSTIHDIVDWRPFDYVTWHIRLPMGAIVRQTAEFTPLDRWRHASVAALREAGGTQSGGDGAGAHHHAARDGEETRRRPARVEDRAGTAGGGRGWRWARRRRHSPHACGLIVVHITPWYQPRPNLSLRVSVQLEHRCRTSLSLRIPMPISAAS